MEDILDLSHIPRLYTPEEVLKKKTEARKEERNKAAQIARKVSLEFEKSARQLKRNPEVAERLLNQALVGELIAAKINKGGD